MKLVFLGPPGAGKGTQAEQIAEKYHLVHLSTGSMLRAAIAAKTELGNKVQSIVKNGGLVPDNIILDLVTSQLKSQDGFVLDGFPRTLVQGERLRDQLKVLDKQIDGVILFNVDEGAVFERIKTRASAENRADDTPETFTRRMSEYHKQTAPLIAFYRSEGLLQPIDAMKDIKKVTQTLVGIVDKFHAEKSQQKAVQ